MRQVTSYSKKRLLIVAHITLLALFFNLNTISAQSYTVDNRGVCSNVNASQPYCTIQGAIDDVASGTTITVAPGTYNENIVINRPVNLRGNNADINPNTTARNAETIIRPVVTNPTTATTVYVRSSDVTVNGFQVISGGDPSQQAGIGGYAEVISNVTTSNNIIENYSQHGIRFDSPAPATPIRNITIRNNLVRDIYGGGGIMFRTNVDGTIEGNVIENVVVGLRVDWLNGNAVGQLHIRDNVVYNSTNRGLWLNVIGIIPAGYDVQITDNAIWANGGRGIHLTSFGNGQSPVVRDNDVDGAERGYDVWVAGTPTIVIDGGTITNNQYGIYFSDSTTPLSTGGSAFYGISQSNSLTVRNTTLANNVVGVHFVDSFSGRRDENPISPDTTIQHNLNLLLEDLFIVDNDTGILVEIDANNDAYTPGDQMYLTVQNSNITDNGRGVDVTADIHAGNRINLSAGNCFGNNVDIFTNSPTGTINATNNWWEGTPNTAGSGNSDTTSPNNTTPPAYCNVVVPIPHNDNFTTPFNTPLSNANVASNDVNVNPNNITIGTVTGGTATSNGNGTITFTPAVDFFGTAYVYYNIFNPAGTMSRQGLARIEILPPAVLNVSVRDQNGALLNGQTYTVARDSIVLTFDSPVYDDGLGTDPDSASNPDNYILIEEGTASGFQTASCVAGVSPQDNLITPTSVNHVPATNTTTLTFSPALSDGSYQLLVCGSTSIVSRITPNVTLNGGTDEIINFTINAVGVPTTPTPPATGGGSGALPQPEDLAVEFLPSTGESPIWAELLRKWFGW